MRTDIQTDTMPRRKCESVYADLIRKATDSPNLSTADCAMLETMMRMEVGLDQGGLGCLDGLSPARFRKIAREQVAIVQQAAQGDAECKQYMALVVREAQMGGGL